MPPRTSRRRALQAAGIALATGLAGCELKRRTPSTTTTDGEPTTAPRTDTGGGTGTTPTGTRTTTATPTVGPGRTYTAVVENTIASSALAKLPDVPADVAATVTFDVEQTRRGTETTLFERTIDLPPGETRRFEDAFSTKTNGPSYVVRAKMEKFREVEGPVFRNLSDARRFEEGGFQSPPGTTFEVTIGSTEVQETLVPALRMDVPED